MAKDCIPDQRDENNAKARPKRINDTDRHVAQGQGHEVKADRVADNHKHRRPKPRKLLAGLHG